LWDLLEAYFDDIDGPDPCFDSEADQPVECDNSSRPIRAPDNQPVPNVAFQESKAECIEFWDGIAAHLDDGKGEDPSCLPGADVELDVSADKLRGLAYCVSQLACVPQVLDKHPPLLAMACLRKHAATT
jgi:hypothetical protein